MDKAPTTAHLFTAERWRVISRRCKYQMMARPAKQCFKESDTVRAAHLLYDDFLQERKDIPKMVFYLYLQREYFHLRGFYKEGKLNHFGYRLEFILNGG